MLKYLEESSSILTGFVSISLEFSSIRDYRTSLGQS
jgi:hypothetical protein